MNAGEATTAGAVVVVVVVGLWYVFVTLMVTEPLIVSPKLTLWSFVHVVCESALFFVQPNETAAPPVCVSTKSQVVPAGTEKVLGPPLFVTFPAASKKMSSGAAVPVQLG